MGKLMKTIKIRAWGASKLLSMRETYTCWRQLAYAIGLLLPIPYDWLEDHTIAKP